MVRQAHHDNLFCGRYNKGISKKNSVMLISKETGVPLSQFLGVGDGMTDWTFMEICGYAGAMGNSVPELKRKVITKANGQGYIGKSVDENGILDIFTHFGL